MPLNFENDLDHFFDVDEFATPVQITIKETGQVLNVKGLLNGNDINPTSNRVEIEDVDLQIQIPTKNIASVVEHDTITIDGVSYTINAVQPDMTGLTVLEFHYAEPDN